MPLREYKKKRKFTSTTEPFGESQHKTQGKLHFLVQKHRASHLHYDFRLEMAGVLKSWAVPKGPSLNPRDKRLAMMVEDHPYEYKDFEGIIPKGNYGAGEVIIWDEGYYEPTEISANNVSKQLLQSLHKGHLSIFLHGKKLKGEFSLIKLKNAKDNSWLLIKKADSYSTEKNILEKNKSVRSKKTIESLSNSNTKNSKIPKNIHPMLAKLVLSAFNNKDWIFEIKWDGFRMLAFVDGKNVKLISRNKKNYTEVFLPIAEELSKLKIKAIFDGEIVVVDKNGRSSFQLLQKYQKNFVGHLKYFVFDILWLNGNDLTQETLLARKFTLEKTITDGNLVKLSQYIPEQGIDFFKAAEKNSLEGIMAKKINSTYKQGQRTGDWLKIKTKHRQEAIICGYTQPRVSRKDIGALVLGVYRGKKLHYIGHSGSGLNTATINELKRKLDKITQPSSPFSSIVKTNMPVTWVKPQLICEIEFTEWTDDQQMRHPVFLGLREDKSVRNVTFEQAIVNPQEESNDSKKSNNENKLVVNIGHHQQIFTNLNKLFWPDDGYTKKSAIDYYHNIAPWILPYLKNRPESLLRHPNGINEASFFQKNIEHAPGWVKIKPIFSEHEQRDIKYLICQNEATLLYMINLGCIEINPWLSRLLTLEKPDFCIIDLDPEDIDFKAVIKVAQSIKAFLDQLGVDCYCKTSGATGLHICIPLGAKYTYDQSKQFAEIIANQIHQVLPDITSIIRSPQKRQGKVYLDFLQNRKGQTITAPYAIRPRPGAPVSTPLLWEEVNARLNPNRFTIKTIFKRLEKYGDLWQPVMGKGVNLSKILKIII